MKIEKIYNLYKKIHLDERYINLFKDDLKQYIDIIWDMLQKAYKDLDGGFATASTPEELINKTWLTKCVRRDGKIVACRLYSDKFGRKSIAGATDGTAVGKAAFYKLIEEDITQSRAWGEVSDKMEHVMIKRGGVPVPNIYAHQLTKKEILQYNPDGYHYTRMIAGQPHEKIIFAYNGFVSDKNLD